MNWDTADWIVFCVAAFFVVLYVWAAAGFPRPHRKKPVEPYYGEPPYGPHIEAEDADVDAPETTPVMFTWFVNGDPMCVAEEVDTEFGFWEFYNGEDWIMTYMPRPGDTLTCEDGEAL